MRRVAHLFTVVLALSACRNASDVLLERLEECDLVTEGELSPYLLSGVYLPDDCYTDCIAGASCEQLEDALLCRTDLSLLIACDQRCAFACGDGSLIAIEQQCDGVAQCADESDEAGCPASDEDVDCGDGTGARRCNGGWECSDGRDERDCFPTCDGGARILYDWVRCDGYPHCSDGADEAGCPRYGCADGSSVAHREGMTPRCNGWRQCTDGSDEAGCARLSFSCE